jgi:hypothetical protein
MSVYFERIVRWILRKCGYLLIPFDELFDMERTGRESYRAMKKQQTDKDYGYFNGIADHASKTALLWRQKYLSPNASGEGRELCERTFPPLCSAGGGACT